MSYDARGQLVRTVKPDGSEALVVTGGVLFGIGTDNGSTRRWRIESWFK